MGWRPAHNGRTTRTRPGRPHQNSQEGRVGGTRAPTRSGGPPRASSARTVEEPGRRSGPPAPELGLGDETLVQVRLFPRRFPSPPGTAARHRTEPAPPERETLAPATPAARASGRVDRARRRRIRRVGAAAEGSEEAGEAPALGSTPRACREAERAPPPERPAYRFPCRTDVLPTCHVTLRGQKPQTPPPYKSHPSTLGEWIRKQRILTARTSLGPNSVRVSLPARQLRRWKPQHRQSPHPRSRGRYVFRGSRGRNWTEVEFDRLRTAADATSPAALESFLWTDYADRHYHAAW